MPRFTMPFVAAFDGNGRPMAGAKLYFYEAGTTTPRNTYSDAALTVANTNPVIADAAGQWPAVWLANEPYKVVLKTSGDATVWTADDVRVADPELSASETVEGLARVATQAETEAGTDDATIVTPKKLLFGFEISLEPNGYVKFPAWLGGVILQWGSQVVATTSEGGGTLAWPTSFPNGVFTTILANGDADAATFTPQPQYSVFNTTGVAFKEAPISAPVRINFIAVGH